MKKAFLILSLFLASAVMYGQEFIAYRDSVANGYNFWLSVPENYDSLEVDVPVVIFLHGKSLCGNNLYQLNRYGTLDAIKRGRQIPALVIAPQNPGNWWNPQRVDNVLEWVMARYNGDRNRVYVLGMSLGGYGTIDYVGTYPDKVAAAIGLCGGTTLKDYDNLRQLPLWIVHGTADRKVGIGCSKRIVEGMQQLGDTPLLRYDWMQGYNHSDLARFFYMPETYEWLFSHRADVREIQEPFALTNELMNNAYRGWNNHNDVHVSDPPRKGYHPVRTRRHVHPLDSLMLPAVDTLQLLPDDLRIVMFGDGCWACVDSNGLLSVTDSASVTKVLNGDGTWVALVPREEQSEPVPEETPTENAQPAAIETEKEKEEEAEPEQDPEPEQKPEPEPEVQYHTVQSGDTLYKLARKYGTTVAELCRLNRIKEDSVIRIGQKLRVK